MARFRTVNGIRVDFTAAEETARDAEEAAAAAGPTQAEIDASLAPDLDRIEEIADLLGIASFNRTAALATLKTRRGL